ncbi:hypothetical protein [Rubellicoccus peritrichatus]|uniref:PEP-CTERM protein-sorting domain-containing protein n=1 Tax=Rubellicoccus peritrichatus TaxID=3080537 RepID=A0AAQ3LB86_9BACT|nr:hypothetical protein [Puniceicoccus sp. CR14]WOO40735.1 hypothetical protein RZN69_19100 [Puniceicoccus sp. CR14]
MKLRYICMMLLASCALSAQTTIVNWGTGLVIDEIVQSDGETEATPSDFTFQLGTFGSFVPTENNIEDWAANWKVLDEISASDADSSDRFFDFSDTNGAFVGSDTLNADQTSASLDSNGTDIFNAGEQAYVWVFDNQNITETSEWALYTQALAGPCDNCLDGPWQIPDADSTTITPSWFISEADTAVFGRINDSAVVGAGIADDTPSSLHIQTHRGGRGSYWDLNGSTIGSAAGGTTQTWNSTNAFWNRRANGTRPTRTFREFSVATFSAGTDANGTDYTVIKEGNENVFGLDFENGNTITIEHGTNGSITFDRNGGFAFLEEDGVGKVKRQSFINVESGVTADIKTVLAGTRDVAKTGSGTLILSGNTESTLSGELSVENGILQMSGTGTDPRINTDIKVNGGTLFISETDPTNNNQFGSNTNLTYENGLIQVGEANESLGTLTLTLTEDSNLDMTGDSTTSKIFFEDSSGEDWSGSGSNQLLVTNWDGVVNYGGGNDQIFFGSSITGLTAGQLDRIKFVNPADRMGTYDAIILSTGEIVPFIPIPEPTTIFGGIGLTALALTHFYRMRKRKLSGATS